MTAASIFVTIAVITVTRTIVIAITGISRCVCCLAVARVTRT